MKERGASKNAREVNFMLHVSSVINRNAHPFYRGADAVVETIIDPKEISSLSMDKMRGVVLFRPLSRVPIRALCPSHHIPALGTRAAQIVLALSYLCLKQYALPGPTKYRIQRSRGWSSCWTERWQRALAYCRSGQ